jgi:formylglycine-generating enzyme required for sulfatase activity
MLLQNHRVSKRILIVTLVLLMVAVGAAKWLRSTRSPVPSAGLQCDLAPQPSGAPHPGLVWVPGGRFELGDDQYPEEQPIASVELKGFWMDRTEVTNDQFAAFVKATGYVTEAERSPDAHRHQNLSPDMAQPGAVVFKMPEKIDGSGDVSQWWRFVPGANWRHPGGPDTDLTGHGAFPVVAVTYQDALAYARWAGRDLPSEAQWEWAARAGQTRAAQDHEQPNNANTWQGLFPVVNTIEDGFVGLAPVGCYEPNAFGLYDMVGNVWELTADLFRGPHLRSGEMAEPGQVPADIRPGVTQQRVIKGGSFLCAPNYCMRYRSGARQPQEEDLGASHLGFRTILFAAPP